MPNTARALLSHPNSTQSYTVDDGNIIKQLKGEAKYMTFNSTIYGPNTDDMYEKVERGEIRSPFFYIRITGKEDYTLLREEYAIKVRFYLLYSICGEVYDVNLKAGHQLNEPGDKQKYEEEEKLHNYPALNQEMHKLLNEWAKKWEFDSSKHS